MSILIKGMEMPRNCDDCHLDIDCAYDESQDGYRMMGGRPRKCPLVPVPPHGRMVDLDEMLKDLYTNYRYALTRSVLDRLEASQIIIPADPAEEGET